MKCLVPSKRSKHFGFPGDILKIVPTPVIFEITTTGALRWGCQNCIMATMSKFTTYFSRNRKKIKMLSILINVFKNASTQTKPKKFKSVCTEIIIYDSEKAYKDYNIF